MTRCKRHKFRSDETGDRSAVTACCSCRLVLEQGIEASETVLTLGGLTEMISRAAG